MKKILLLLCVLITHITIAQNELSYDERLLFRFTQSELDDIALVNPHQIEYLNFYVENACFFINVDVIPDEKQEQFPDVLNYLSLPEGYELEEDVTKKNFNILMYDVEFYDSKKNTYKLGENLLVVLRSKQEVYDLFNQLSDQ